MEVEARGEWKEAKNWRGSEDTFRVIESKSFALLGQLSASFSFSFLCFRIKILLSRRRERKVLPAASKFKVEGTFLKREKVFFSSSMRRVDEIWWERENRNSRHVKCICFAVIHPSCVWISSNRVTSPFFCGIAFVELSVWKLMVRESRGCRWIGTAISDHARQKHINRLLLCVSKCNYLNNAQPSAA